MQQGEFGVYAVVYAMWIAAINAVDCSNQHVVSQTRVPLVRSKVFQQTHQLAFSLACNAQQA